MTIVGKYIQSALTGVGRGLRDNIVGFGNNVRSILGNDKFMAEKFGWVPLYGDYKRYQAQARYNREYEQRTGYQPYSPWLGGSGNYANPSYHLGRIFSTGMSYGRRGLSRRRNKRRNYRR